ncbi:MULTISPECIES: hypothetical protein [unclassified Cupriavidus]|uniref:hypothetical protein n=1 Tax=unclassified Cupriavidus TaxID=2640874 RepID=UPI001AE32037|nr:MULTISPECIES: hypothetical protein [unclassified Cupriavidus]MBP0633178.1 hypothetical protein [Cupriavidus sp. AcVe19-1a]MBP0639639.1 hypothetical protein [Cupriavidus sp. AcVe19-6a]
MQHEYPLERFSASNLAVRTSPTARGCFVSLNWEGRVSSNLFNMLGSGGTLQIANFLPGIEDVGFMEVAMDWWLIYRDEKEMLALLAGLPDTAIAAVRQYRDPDNNITFLEVQRQ